MPENLESIAPKKIIVTGGSGFVGFNLCKRLIKEGYRVISITRKKSEKLEAMGVSSVTCDISQLENVPDKVWQDAIAIFHTAALVKMWGNYQEFKKVNIEGTEKLIAVAKKFSIPKLIYTSSPSVIADGKNLQGVNESYPYPSKVKAYYPATKAQAEKLVLQANSLELKTLSLRPHLIWGPGDTNLIPTILEKAKAGQLMIIGDGENKVDISYIDDCVNAHYLALQALDSNSHAAGKAYFISQGRPVKLWEWINEILVRSGEPSIKRKIPFFLADSIARVLEFIHQFLPKSKEPRLTRFLVSEMATDHYFDISRARELLGYQPQVSIKEGLGRTFSSKN